jgi:hypothetical protein
MLSKGFPRQQLPFSAKGKAWRKSVVDWADNQSLFDGEAIRKSAYSKKINYDLYNGILHMKDLQLVVNPEGVKDVDYVPEKIQHYPIMNSKLDVLIGEERTRGFDYRVIVTNPTSISEKEEEKANQLFQMVQSEIQNTSQSEEDFMANMEKIGDFFTYSWQDLREMRSTYLLEHYEKEYDFDTIFNSGFTDALICGEEIYQCDIVGGEPTLEKIDPQEIRIYRSGHSNKVEDADLIIIEKYMSPGKVIDTFYDVLTKKDVEYIEKGSFKQGARVDDMDNVDERATQVAVTNYGNELTSAEDFFWNPIGRYDSTTTHLAPFDRWGNVRVLRVYWKSRRKIKRIKSYDPQTGEEIYSFRTETYVPVKELGEEEKIYYINEAWEGTKIGEDVYVNMRPRVIQYNKLSNPSKCHFGIIGSIYGINGQPPFSLVDKMKNYNYLYDVIHDRLNKLIAANWGTIIEMDLAKIPDGWTVSKWLHYAKVNHIAVIDSFNEGKHGAALNKVVGGMNTASRGVLNAELGNSIQQYVNILEYIKSELGEVSGINRQREGQVANRETVGGVERANLQSSHITEWLFATHENVRKRVTECFLETAKISLKGRSKKFQYLLPNGMEKMIEIDGDEFAESDYGLVVDNGSDTQQLKQIIPQLAQAALQNQLLDFSTVLNLYSTASMVEKRKMIENSEKKAMERAQQAQQAEQQAAMEQQQMLMQQEQAKLQHEDMLNQRDNETKLIIANINAQTKMMPVDDGVDEISATDRAKLAEQIREFDARLKFDKEKLQVDSELKRKQIASKPKTTSK